MKDNWSCGCSMLGGHVCGKQITSRAWGTLSDRKDIFTPGDRVRCSKQFPDANGAFDGDIGMILEVDKERSQPYKVSFDEGFNYQTRWCYEVEKV